jgi:outer membrane protein
MGDQKNRSTRVAAAACGVGLIALAIASSAQGETIGGALSKAYLNNPDINTQRAAVRAADEGVPQANAGYLPTIQGNANAGFSHTEGLPPFFGPPTMNLLPRGYGLSAQETLFNGQKTFNSVRKAESTVLGAREQLRYTEENTLLTALTAYMDVMRDTAALGLRRSNVEVLKEQLRQTKDRFNVGEVTRTDVAQAESSLAQSQADYLVAMANLQGSISRYRQAIGDQPRQLQPVTPVARLLPATLTQAIAISQVENPAITAYLHGVDVALLQVKINEAALYPTVTLQGSVSRMFDTSGFPGTNELVGSVVGNINIPIWDGGASFASIRQAKEQVSQQEMTVDSWREKVRQEVVASWFNNLEAPGVVKAAKAQVKAAEIALEGVREEAKVGQRTTLDVLNAQQTLVQARLALVQAQRDQVVYSYTLLASIGRLSVKHLGLGVVEYDPSVHFNQVKVKQFGVRTPDGR